MSFAIDLREHGSDLKKQYESVISSDPDTTWAVFDYDGTSSALKPGPSGSGDLDEFTESFDDARIQYGLTRVEFNSVNKIVLVGWVGENVNARQRLTFNAHMSAVAKQFPGHHIQLTARSSDELTPKIILDKVNAAAGSKYAGSTRLAPPTKPKYVQADEGANEDDWSEAKPVEERDLSITQNGYKSSVREELEQLRKGKKPSSNAESKFSISGLDSGTSYQPVGKIDLKKIREEAKGSKFADSRIEKIEPSYKPVGKVDLKAIREHAKKQKELKASKEDSFLPKPQPEQETKKEPEEESEEEPKEESNLPKRQAKQVSNDDDEPQFASLADRMKAFQESVSGAKPKFETSSSRTSASSRQSQSPRPTPPRSIETSKNDEDEDEDKDVPVSVAAQLAKARLSRTDEPDHKEPSKNETNETGQMSNVSNFAARFSKQEPKESTESKEPENADGASDEEEVVPAPPRRAPAPTSSASSASSASPPAPPARRSDPVEEDKKDDQEQEGKGITAIAIEEYPSGDDDEITLKKGEPIIRIQKVDENWWIGETPDGAVGLFPKDYVKLDSDDNEDIASSQDDLTPTQKQQEKALKAETQGKVAIAQYSYEAGDDDELSFSENEKITEIDFPSEDWWSGKNSKGDFGLFPSSYVTLQ